MTQEEKKELLLQDLCARLPYGVKINFEVDTSYDTEFDSVYQISHFDGELLSLNVGTEEVELSVISNNMNVIEYIDELLIAKPVVFTECIPYLIPLSKMTEEQKEELLYKYIHNDIYFDDFTDYFLAGELWHDICVSMDILPELINWLNKNHFDYRGLIPMGLAIDATGLNIY